MSGVEKGPYAVLPLGDWSTKLAALQNEHQKEAVEQQRAHLEQLHLLQEQLLDEVSDSMNRAVTEMRASSTSPHKVPLSTHLVRPLQLNLDHSDPFMKSTKTPRSPAISPCGRYSCYQPDTTAPHSDSASACLTPLRTAPPAGIDVLRSPRCRTASMQLDGLSPARAGSSPIRSSPPRGVSWIDDTMPHLHYSNPVTTISAPTSVHSAPQCSHMPSHCSYPTTAPAHSHPLPHCSPKCPHMPPRYSSPPPHYPHSHLPPHHHTGPHSHYSTPPHAHTPPRSPHYSHSPHSHDTPRYSCHHIPKHRLPPSIPPPSAACKPHEVAMARAALVEKHTKHIDDLKRFYESEISTLEQKLMECGSVMKKATPIIQALEFESPTGAEDYHRHSREWRQKERERIGVVEDLLAKVKMLQSENTKLDLECLKLREMLEKSKRKCQMLIEQERQSEEHIMEWQQHCESSDKMVSVLQERLDNTRKQMQSQEEESCYQLQQGNEELQSLKSDRENHMKKMTDLLEQLEELRLENSKLRAATQAYHEDMEMSRAQLAAIRTSVDRYKETDERNRRTIHNLEDQVRHLEHMNNRMRGMGTQYQLGYYNYEPMHDSKSSPKKSTTSPAHSATPTSLVISRRSPQSSPLRRHKRQSSPVIIKHYPGSSPSTSDTTTPTTQPQKGSSISHGELTTALKESKKKTPQHQTPIVVDGNRSLTRRKWLEASDPGLFGVSFSSSSSPSNNNNNSSKATPSFRSMGSTNGDKNSPSGKRTTPARNASTGSLNGPLSSSTPTKNSKLDDNTVESKNTPEHSRDSKPLNLASKIDLASKIETSPSVAAVQNTSSSSPKHSGSGASVSDTTPEGIQLDPLASSVLKAIQEGKITAVDAQQQQQKTKKGGGGGGGGGGRKKIPKSQSDVFKEHVDTVAETEQQLDRLMVEKELLESALQRSPRVGGGIMDRQTKLMQEQRLNEVIYEIGGARMILKKHNALGPKTS